MLPFSLKAVWFSLSLAGLLSNWVVLPGFVRYVCAAPWVPLLYTAANTVLQGIFCLGLIWNMNPLKMPQAFRIAQTVLTQVSWASLAGLCATVALSSAAAVFTSYSGFSRFRSRLPMAIALNIIFPVVVVVLQLTFLLKLNAVQPTDGMSCDASHPSWIRVLGYSGLTLLLSVPSFILSVVTAVRLLSRNRRPAKSRPVSHAISTTRDTLTPIPIRRDRKLESKPSSMFSSLVAAEASTPYIKPSPVMLHNALRPESLGRAPTQAKHSKYHLPFVTTPQLQPQLRTEPSSRRESAQSQVPSQLRRSPALDSTLSRQGSSQNSPSPIIFATPPAPGQAGQNTNPNLVVVTVSHSPSPVGQDESEKDIDVEVVDQVGLNEQGVTLDETESIQWVGESDRGSIGKDDLAYDTTEEGETGEYVFPPYPRIRRVASGLPPWLDEPAEPDPSLARTVAFQIFIAAIQILAAITSLVDISSKRSPPSPLGTQHVAQLLAAWGPCLFVCTLLLCRYLRGSGFRT